MTHWRSKKWAAALLGSAAVLCVFGVTTGAVLFAPPEKAAHLAGLANIATVALSALITSLVAGQSCVDWRHGSATGYAAEEWRTTQESIERVFAPKHYDDPALS